MTKRTPRTDVQEQEIQHQEQAPLHVQPDPITPPAPLSLDDVQDQVAPAPSPTPEPVATPPAEPMSEEQILGLIGFLTSMGLPTDAVQAYQMDLLNNPLLKMFLPMLDLPAVLAKYGIGAGSGGPMPEWLRGVLGVGLVGYVVVTTRSQYANRPDRQADPVSSLGGDGGADLGASGLSSNIPSGLGSF